MIKRLCAWCGALLGYKPDHQCKGYERRFGETHGICAPCMRRETGDESGWDAWRTMCLEIGEAGA